MNTKQLAKPNQNYELVFLKHPALIKNSQLEKKNEYSTVKLSDIWRELCISLWFKFLP
jgi:hypothetical protein